MTINKKITPVYKCGLTAVAMAIVMALGATLHAHGSQDGDYDFRQAEREFSAAGFPAKSDAIKVFLGAEWSLVGKMHAPKASFMLENQSDPDGLKNKDGSRAGIKFLLDGKKLHAVIKTLGPKDVRRGPFELEINSTAAKFSAYAYKIPNDTLVDDSHFDYRCRLVDRMKGLLCRLIFIVDDARQISDESKDLNAKTIGYYRYSWIRIQ